ncbi:transposase [Thiorhodospira sibirica]|uniref:transposase n=1 Tax=Thiorhodospira sibirica TaxID=154347 RepID=UPI003AB91FBC
MQRLSRSLSRTQKSYANRKKAKGKLARLHARIANIRSDALHQLTTNLARRFHRCNIFTEMPSNVAALPVLIVFSMKQ